MIGRLRGELLEVAHGIALIEVGGVGYEVVVPEDLALRLPSPGDEVTLAIRQIVREDGSTLYGFPQTRDRRVFDLLLKVNGCGPRVALAILAQVGPEATIRAILENDLKRLMVASGVGKRLGERILLELRPSIEEEAAALSILPSGASLPQADEVDRDLLDALLALGYRANEAERAAAEVPPGGDLDRRIVAALQRLKR